MSLLRSLLSLVAVVCAAPLCAAEWPCPLASAISPCICSTTASYEINVDCSNVQSSDQLAKVFQTAFAFPDLNRLTIDPVVPYESLLYIPAGVFGAVSFKEVDITNTVIHTVEEEALVNSHNTLERLNMEKNKIRWFPFETLKLYVQLTELDLSYNKLSGVMPDIEMDALISLDLSGNTGFTLTQTVFTGSPTLEVLRLNDMGLNNTTPPNVFLTLNNLRTLYLQDNSISGTLIEDFINTELQPLTAVYLDGNLLFQIHPLSLTGLSDEGTVSFRNNLIESLEQERWEGLVSRLTADAIDMRGNPLTCGCEIEWLVFDSSAMAVFNDGTTCWNGTLLVESPEQWFIDHCS